MPNKVPFVRVLSFFGDDASMESVFDEFANGNYQKLEEMTNKLNIEQRHELAQLLIALSDITDRTRNLMEWVYQCEVDAAASSMTILKTDANMMSTIVGTYLCYSYNSVRWLKMITVPLIEYLESQPEEANATTEQGANILMEASEITLSRFFETILDVPLWLRQSCVAYQQASDRKFGSTIGSPRPPGLLCGYLVSVLTTEKNAIVGDVSTKVKRGLRAVAGILLQLGYQFGTIENEMLKDFITRKTPELIYYYNEFINPEEISMCEQVLISSRRRDFAREIRLRAKKQRFIKLMISIANPDFDTQSVSSDSTGSDEVVSVNDSIRLIQKMDHSEWKHLKTLKGGAKMYTWKSDEAHFLSLKVEMRIQANLLDAAQGFTKLTQDPKVDPTLELTSRVRVSENVNHIYGYSVLPWPITNRYFAYYEAEFLDNSKNQIVVVYKNAPYVGPTKKMVETKVFLCGLRLVIDPNDSNFLKVSVIIHADPGGSIPVWFANKVVGEQGLKWIKVAKILEDEAKLKQSKMTQETLSATAASRNRRL